MRRMDRYSDNSVSGRRSEKNQDLYQNVSINSRFTNITDVTNANAFEINNRNESKYSREDYQKMRKYQGVDNVPKVKKELEDINHLYQRKENKIYDINSVLEEARKNRQEKDNLDEKRKLKNNRYNALADGNDEEIKKYREEKKKRMNSAEEDEIRELIDTIASKTLAGEISKETTVDLLSDLMATNIMDKVTLPTETEEPTVEKEVLIEEEVIEVVQKAEEQPIEKKTTMENADSDFYTRSMDLSDKDFDFGDDFKEKKMPLIVKILIFLLIIAVIAVAAYFIYQRI